MGEEATKTIQTRLHVASGERSWLHDARLASREIFNQTIRLKNKGTPAPRYNERLTATTFCETTSARSSANPSKRGTPTNRSKRGGRTKTTLMEENQPRQVRTNLVHTRS